MSSWKVDKRAIIKFYNSDFLPAGTLARMIAVEVAIMPNAESETERRIIHALAEYYALDFENLLKVTQVSESELGLALEVMKYKKIIEW